MSLNNHALKFYADIFADTKLKPLTSLGVLRTLNFSNESAHTKHVAYDQLAVSASILTCINFIKEKKGFENP